MDQGSSIWIIIGEFSKLLLDRELSWMKKPTGKGVCAKRCSIVLSSRTSGRVMLNILFTARFNAPEAYRDTVSVTCSRERSGSFHCSDTASDALSTRWSLARDGSLRRFMIFCIEDGQMIIFSANL